MTDHDRARELAAAAFDFELSPADRAELRDHLAGCAQCHVFEEGLAVDARALAGLPAPDAPDGLRSRVVDGEAALDDAPSAGAGTMTRRPAPIIPIRYRRPAALVASAAVVVALIGGMLVWGSRPGDGGVAAISPSPDVPIASGWRSLGPGESPGAPGAPGASGVPGSVEATGDWHAVAALVPDGSDGTTVGLDGTFRLTSLDGTAPAELAARIRVDPPVALAVAPEPDGNGLRLTPSEPLVPGTVYRFTLAGPTGETVDSWAFQTTAPLKVVSMLPEEQETDVPLNTGIEVTFDQDGVTDAASHVTIEPKTAGRFEQHGRVLSFVPDALKPGTIYTVTVGRGITAGPGGTPLADDVKFEFETAKPGAGEPAVTFDFADVLFESGTTARPIISMWSSADEEKAQPRSAPLDIYRLGSLDAAVDAYRQLQAFPSWAQWSNEHPVDTGPLTKVASLDARLAARPDGPLWTALPEPLPAGWYLVESPATPYAAQSILQVTDIASYLLVTETKTLLWANDLATGGPLQGAAVAVGGAGAGLGATDVDGVLTVATPATLQWPADPTCASLDCIKVATVTAGGRSSFVPASDPRPEGKDGYSGDAGHRWLTFSTDRTLYRRTDTVNLWGMIRDRTTGKVPPGVVVRLQAMDEDFVATGAPISTVHLVPGSTGTFSGSIALTDVPEGSYALELVDGSEIVQTVGFQVDRILKPAYRLEVETGHRAYVVGERIKATILASFFEGSPVPGVPLRVSQGGNWTVATDKSGTAVVRTTARLEESNEGDPEIQSVSVSPRRAEEGQIQGASRDFLVFPSSRTITAESRISTGRVRVAGTVNALDRAGLERALAGGVSPWEVDARGAPVGGVTVTATFVEQIPVKTRIGTDYDFIEKRTVPVYEYTTRQRDAGSVRVRTDAHGRFTASVAAGSAHHDYAVLLRVADPDGHTARRTTYANDAEAPAYDGSRQPELVPTSGVEPPDGYSVGSPIDLTLRDPAHPRDTTSRYLFNLTQLGLHDVVVQGSPRFVGAFQPWAVPNVLVTGVRFTGSAYSTAEYSAAFRIQDRRIDVRLTPDKARYSPRDQVTVGVTTTDAAGKPVAASVVLRAIDEKLFVIGGAELDDPLSDVYAALDPGIISTYTSHHGPPVEGGGGGDTTGGGGDDARSEFRDSLLFKTVDTGADGRASTSFRLSDDLTSWRILGSAFSTDLETGTGSTEVAVGLPFFVDASIAPEYLVTDRPTIVARAFGTALPSGARVTISAASPSLGLKGRPIAAAAFADVPIRLPALTLGTHSVTITATYGTGPSARTDVLVRTFTVVRSRLAATRTAYADVTGTVHPDGGATGRTRVVVADRSAGRHLPLLTELAAGDGVRLERALAAAAARDLLTRRYGESESEIPAGDFTGARYQQEDGGISLVPAGSSDLQASALAALTDPDPFSKTALRQYFEAILSDGSATRERHVYALAGLAGLHATVLPQLRAAAADDGLTIRERLMVGLGAAALGDATTARSIASSLISRYGEQQAGWARLRVGKSVADGVEGTALMAILAAATGEPLAPAFWAYVEANPMPDLVTDLHAIGYVERLMERLPPQAGSFAYTVDGTRTVVDLEPGGTFSMTLTASQLSTLAIERLAGTIGVSTDWREPVKAATIERDPDITVTRSVRPSGTIGSGDLVIVSLKVRFGKQAPLGCHLVTELVPSGLVAVGQLEGVFYSDSVEPPEGVTPPFEQTGQRLSFCAENETRDHVAELQYVARVITPGTYTWEPAVVESRTSANHGALTDADTVTIR